MTENNCSDRVLISHYQKIFNKAIELKVSKMKHYGINFFKQLHKNGFTGILGELSRKGARVDALIRQCEKGIDPRVAEPMMASEILDLMLDLQNYAMDGYIQYCRENGIMYNKDKMTIRFFNNGKPCQCAICQKNGIVSVEEFGELFPQSSNVTSEEEIVGDCPDWMKDETPEQKMIPYMPGYDHAIIEKLLEAISKNILIADVFNMQRKGIELILKKNSDYAGNADPYKNFNAAQAVNVHPAKAILVRMSDKLIRTANVIDKGSMEVEEDLEETLIDFSNYCLILASYLKRHAGNRN